VTRLLHTLLLCLALLTACPRAPAREPLLWQEALPGLTYARAEVLEGADQQPVTLHLLRLEPRSWQLRVVTPEKMGRPLGSPADFRAAIPGAVAAVNGGFFDPAYKPLGLLVDNGQTLSPLRHVDHGVFGIAAQQPLMRHARDWKELPELEFAVECGPRLLVDGQPLTFKTGKARRTALGLDGHGRVLLVVSEGVLQLRELANFLRRSEPDGGPGIVDALNLDGGPSTMLEIDAGAIHANVPTPVQVPVGIVVSPRHP
jgi:uncharacterized protein YigE (DUF2233 family)